VKPFVKGYYGLLKVTDRLLKVTLLLLQVVQRRKASDEKAVGDGRS